MSGYLIGGGLAAFLILLLFAVVLVRRGRARRTPDRDEIMRRASAATGRIVKDNRRTGRGSMRGGGLGEHNNATGSDGGSF